MGDRPTGARSTRPSAPASRKPPHQLPSPEVFRHHPVDRGNRPPQTVVSPPILPAFLDRHKIRRVFHDAQEVVAARRVCADRARILIRDIETARTMYHGVWDRGNRFPQLPPGFRRRLEHVEGTPRTRPAVRPGPPPPPRGRPRRPSPSRPPPTPRRFSRQAPPGALQGAPASAGPAGESLAYPSFRFLRLFGPLVGLPVFGLRRLGDRGPARRGADLKDRRPLELPKDPREPRVR